MIQTVKFPPHPLAKIFPPMSAEDKRELADDIEKHGLQEPIVTFEGMALDGVNRQECCAMRGVEPRYVRFETLNGSVQENGPLAFVISRNLKRRHLSASQRAAIAADALPFFEAEARKRQGKRTDLQTTSPPKGGEVKSAAAAAAKTTGASTRMVERAKKLKAESPAKFEKVHAGELTLTKAERDKAKTEAAKQNLEAAYHRIEQVCGTAFGELIRHRSRLQKASQVLAFADQTDGEMKAQEGLIVLGWPLRKAQLYRAKKITERHTVRDLLNRAASQGALTPEGCTVEVNRFTITIVLNKYAKKSVG